MPPQIRVAVSLAAVSSAALALFLMGLMAGFFYAYGVSVMPGLDAAPPPAAIASMNAINVAVRTGAFLTAFAGAPVVALLGAALCLALGRRAAAALLLAAALAYLLGAVAPTSLVNVPMNGALAALAPDAPDAAAQWAAWSPRWTWWNAMRALASAVALLLVAAAIFALPARVSRLP